MTLHDGYKVGNFWDKVEGLEENGICSICGTHETMTHILTNCRAPGQKLIWDLASALWHQKSKQDLRPTIGQMYAYTLPEPSEEASEDEPIRRRKTASGSHRLRAIITLESAYLIWKMRNDRVINGKDPPSSREIQNRWLHTINGRLKLDCLMTDKKRYQQKALSSALVRATWQAVLTNKGDLPRNWSSGEGEVLVGMPAMGNDSETPAFRLNP